MSNLVDVINKIKKKNIYIIVDFPSLDEISAKHSIFVRRFGIDPEYIVFDPDILTMLKAQKHVSSFLHTDGNLEYLLGMQIITIPDSDTIILPQDDKLARALNRGE